MTYDLVIVTTSPKAYAPQRIKEELTKKNLSCKVLKYEDDIPNAKHIFFRSFGENGKYVDLIKKLNSPKVINYKSFKIWPKLDKLTQYLELQKAKIPVVETSLAPRNDFPFIAKVSSSSQGRGVEKITNDEDLKNFVKKHAGEKVFSGKILFQPFLTAGEDLRIIVIKNKVLGAMKRIARKGKYLTNFSQGGRVENFKLNNDIVSIALAAASHFKLDYCGVDLMQDNGGNWKVLEVNRACQFKGFEKATNINIANLVIEYLLSE
ncbi:MAG TPA: ATP-grasp domain-containing protein [Alphaproteobacteria bacterium]|jgi:RimK family alpha-L-glutamate ligase|nr:ATP-grasp domain-containing protein [Alphaproteobacteria bacterium]